MIDRLKDLFDNVNNWLTFAEAKNAAIIAFSITWFPIVLDVNSETKLSCILISFSSILCIVSIILSLYSFLPRNDVKKIVITHVDENERNLLYYKHIALFKNHDKFYDAVSSRFTDEELNLNKDWCKDYAEEIYINSKIAVIKNELFKYSLCLQIISIVLFAFVRIFI